MRAFVYVLKQALTRRRGQKTKKLQEDMKIVATSNFAVVKYVVTQVVKEVVKY